MLLLCPLLLLQPLAKERRCRAQRTAASMGHWSPPLVQLSRSYGESHRHQSTIDVESRQSHGNRAVTTQAPHPIPALLPSQPTNTNHSVTTTTSLHQCSSFCYYCSSPGWCAAASSINTSHIHHSRTQPTVTPTHIPLHATAVRPLAGLPLPQVRTRLVHGTPCSGEWLPACAQGGGGRKPLAGERGVQTSRARG